MSDPTNSSTPETTSQQQSPIVYEDRFVLWDGKQTYRLYERLISGDSWRLMDTLQSAFSPIMSNIMIKNRWGDHLQHIWGSDPGPEFRPGGA